MATVRDIITRAYRKIGVTAADTPLDTYQGESGLDAFNAMMFGLPILGVFIEHAEQALNDDVALAPQFHEGLVYLLARRLASDSEVPWPDEDLWVRAMQMATISVREMPTDRVLRATPSQSSRQRVIS